MGWPKGKPRGPQTPKHGASRVRTLPPGNWDRHARRALEISIDRLEAARAAARATARAACAEPWGAIDHKSQHRTAMTIAAAFLDQEGEAQLADLLLFARPEFAKDVATGVAVHALRRGHAAVWDALVVGNVVNMDQADEWFLSDETFDWSPPAAWLTEVPPNG